MKIPVQKPYNDKNTPKNPRMTKIKKNPIMTKIPLKNPIMTKIHVQKP